MAHNAQGIEQLNLLRQVIDAAPDAMVLVDRAGKICDCNRPALDIFHYERNELIGQSVEILVPEEQRGGHGAFRSGYLANLEPRPMGRGRDLNALASDGSLIPMEISLTPIETDGETRILAAMRDISLRQLADAARKERDHAIRDRQQAERLGRLAVARETRIRELMDEVNQLNVDAGNRPPYQEKAIPVLEGDAEPAADDTPSDGENFEEIKRDFERLLREERIQELFNNYCESVGIASAIIDLEANVLASSRWQRCCTDFHRVAEDSCANCIESDTDLALNLEKGENFAIYRCKNGMTDCASPILIEGHHVANVFIGQFHLQAPDLGFFSQQANTFGYDEADYLEAIKAAPVMDEAKLPSILGFLAGFARLIGNMAVENRRARLMEMQAIDRAEAIREERAAAMNLAEDANEARRTLEALKADLENQVADRTDELRRRELRVANYNRDLNTLTLVNEAVMKSVNENQLLYEVCRLIVEANGKMVAWVGLIDHGPDKRIDVVNHYGYHKGFLDNLTLTWNPSAHGLGPSGRTVRDGRYTLVNDIANDPGFAPWREPCLERGYHSAISVPLLHQGDAFGVLTIYAGESNGFDEQNVKILQRVADSVSYGVMALRAEQARKTAEANLQDSQAYSDHLLASVEDGIIATDTDGLIQYGNPAAQDLLGIDAAALIERPIFELLAEHDDHSEHPARHAINRGEALLRQSVQLTREDGSRVPVEYSCLPLRETGGTTGGVFVIRDVTRRQQAQAELAQQLHFRQAMLDTIPYPLFYKGADTRFMGFNKAYEEAFDVKREDLIGKRVVDLDYLPEAERLAYQVEDEKVIADAGSASHEMVMTFADGLEHRTLYSVEGFRLADGSPGGLVGTFVDITEIGQDTPETDDPLGTPIQAVENTLSREDLEAAFNPPPGPSSESPAGADQRGSNE